MAKKQPNPRNEKPISLHPLTPEEALRRAMNVKPDDVAESESKEKSKKNAKKGKGN